MVLMNVFQRKTQKFNFVKFINQFLVTFKCYNFYEIERELKYVLRDFRIEKSEVYQIDIKELIKYIEQLIKKKENDKVECSNKNMKVDKNYTTVLEIDNFIKRVIFVKE